jgi:hypothetical protein
VLDTEGLLSRRTSGKDDYKLVDIATCTIWLGHVFPLSGKKELPDDKKEYLIRGCKDMVQCVHAVRERIEEYDAWVKEFSAWLGGAGAAGEAKPVADRVAALAADMQAKIKKYNLEGYRTKGKEWDATVAEVVKKIEGGDIGASKTMGGIRGLAQVQDNAVSDCRRYVKAIRQEVAFVESTSPAAKKFVEEVREHCRRILRRGHPKEMLHSDPRPGAR